jgi:hypothetical protein
LKIGKIHEIFLYAFINNIPLNSFLKNSVIRRFFSLDKFYLGKVISKFDILKLLKIIQFSLRFFNMVVFSCLKLYPTFVLPLFKTGDFFMSRLIPRTLRRCRCVLKYGF